MFNVPIRKLLKFDLMDVDAKYILGNPRGSHQKMSN